MKLRGFALIELIVVMGILAILATIVVIAVNPGRQFAASRNAKRANDTRAIANALNQHAADNNGQIYASITTTPQTIGTSNLNLATILVPNYLSAIPKDPSTGTDADTKYQVYLNSANQVVVRATASELNQLTNSEGVANYAAQFTAANSEYLSIADNATLSIGPRDWSACVWVLPQDLSGNRGILNKWGNEGAPEYVLWYYSAVNRFRWEVMDNASTDRFVDWTSAPTVGQWHFVCVRYTHSILNIGISVNGGAFVNSGNVLTTHVRDGNNGFRPGYNAGVTNYWDGRLDNIAIFPGYALQNADVATLYNNGKALSYTDLTSAQKTAWSLAAWWNLDEVIGNRADSHGSNTLTDNNTVTINPGP